MLLDLVKKRRSIRNFTDEEVRDEDIRKILEIALHAPTAKNRDVIRYIVVKNKEKLKELSTFKNVAAKFLEGANVAIVVLSNKELAENTYHQDACIAATFLQLAVTELGLGSTWANVTNAVNDEGRCSQEVLHEMLEVSDKYNIECIIGIGHIAKEAREKIPFQYETHVEEKFND